MSTESAEIIVHTWPEQWQYWPMYVALARAEQTLSRRSDDYANITFSLQCTTDNPTDNKIRHTFIETINVHPVIALCEPPTVTDPLRGSKLGDISLRKVPLVMRMPLWLLRSTSSLCESDPEMQNVVEKLVNSLNLAAAPASISDLRNFYLKAGDNSKVYGFPRSTTSGDYFRKLLRRLEREGFPNLHPIDITFSTDASNGTPETAILDNIDDGESSISLFTFTPWHIVRKNIIAVAEFPGPLRDITALLVPEAFPEHCPYDPNVIYHEIHQQLNNALKSLLDTDGFDQSMRSLIEDEWWPTIRESGLADKISANTNIHKFLAHYVRRGCYFPYPLVLESIGGEIGRTVANQLKEIQQHAREKVSRKLSSLFGVRRQWQQLSFGERKRCETSWRLPETVGQNEKQKQELWDHLKHMRDSLVRQKNNMHEAATAMAAYVDDLRLDGDDGFRELTMAELFDRSAEHVMCQHEESSIYSATPTNCLSQACTVCRLAGFPRGVIQRGVKMIKSVIDNGPEASPAPKSEALVGCDSECVGGLHASLLCWEDVEGMFNIFKDELRNPMMENNKSPCRIIHARKNNSLAGNVLIGVFWSGSTEKRGGAETGNARRSLVDWCEERNKHGNGPVWVGLGTTDEQVENRLLRSEQRMGQICDWRLITVARAEDWEDAMGDGLVEIFDSLLAKVNGHHFAYLAYYTFTSI